MLMHCVVICTHCQLCCCRGDQHFSLEPSSLDEELPDYIMVMVANKKSAQQMADDLSLFLGNNTIKFTVWYVSTAIKIRASVLS